MDVRYFDPAVVDAALALDDSVTSDQLIDEVMAMEDFCCNQLLPVLPWKTLIINGTFNLTN